MDKVSRCELCQAVLSGAFVDGRTFHGPWAMMCLNCHAALGCGLGTGNGQKYRINPDGSWTKAKPAKAKASELATALERAQQTIAQLQAENARLAAALEPFVEERAEKVRLRREQREAELNVRYLQSRAEQAALDARIALETGINPQQVGALQRVAGNWSTLARAEFAKLSS